MICFLCNNSRKLQEHQILDSKGELVSSLFCNDCGAITPLYSSNQTKVSSLQQGEFHYDFFSKNIEEQLTEIVTGSDDFVSWVLENNLLPAQLRHVVEIGCGRGNLIAAFKQRGFDIEACDISADLVSLAKDFFSLNEKEVLESPALEFVNRSKVLNSDHKVLVLLFHVLEHLNNPLEVIAALVNQQPNRTYIIELPLASPQNVFLEHNFLATPMLKSFLEERFSLTCFDMRVMPDNGFIRFTLGKQDISLNTNFLVKDSCLSSHIEVMSHFYSIMRDDLSEKNNKAILYEAMTDKLRDVALQDIELSMSKGIEILNLAHQSRPNGEFINNRLTLLNELTEKLKGK